MIVNPTLHRNHMTILCDDQCDRIIMIMIIATVMRIMVIMTMVRTQVGW